MTKNSSLLSVYDFLLIILWSLFPINIFHIIYYLYPEDIISTTLIFKNGLLLVIFNMFLFLFKEKSKKSLQYEFRFLVIYFLVFNSLFYTAYYLIYENSLYVSNYINKNTIVVLFIFSTFPIISFLAASFIDEKISFPLIEKGVLIKLLVFNVLIYFVLLVIKGNVFTERQEVVWEKNRVFGKEHYRGIPQYLSRTKFNIASYFDYEILNENLDSIRVQAKMITHKSHYIPMDNEDELFIILQYYFNIDELYSRKLKMALLKLPAEHITEDNIHKTYIQYYAEGKLYTRKYFEILNDKFSLKKRIQFEEEIDSLLQQFEKYSHPIIYLNRSSMNNSEDLKSYMETRPITKLQTEYYKNGNIKFEVYMIDGRLEGTYKIWYESGELQSEIEYENGRRHGKTIEYYKSGQVATIMYYNEGNSIVESRITYYENGDTRTKYINGVELLYEFEN